MAISEMNFIDGSGGGDVQYALNYSQWYSYSSSLGSYAGYAFDTEGNRIDSAAGTIDSTYVTAALSGSSSSTSFTVTAKKAGYYNVLGRKFDGSAVDVSTREYKNVGDTIFTRTSTATLRFTYVIIWLEA